VISQSFSDPTLEKEEVLSLLKPGGVLSFAIPGYEARQAQLDMASDIIDSYNNKKIALIEAGTGTGKSVAYLLPALLFANKNQERTCISTHTINLQEQLLFKDIPFLLKSLNLDLKAVLVKGMNNYLCLRKMHDYYEEKSQLNPEEVKELEKIIDWSEVTQEGSRSDLPFMTSLNIWSEVNAEADTCSRMECPHFKECFFFKARKQAEDAQLLIVNHHLLAVDLMAKQENASGGILPPYKRVVLDEAHHLEDVACEHFAERVTRWDLQRNLARLLSEKKGDARLGKLNMLKKKIDEHFLCQDDDITKILTKIEVDLSGEKQVINHFIQDSFQSLIFFFNHVFTGKETDEGERKWRLKKEHYEHPLWKTEVATKIKQLQEAIKRFIISIESLEADISYLENDKLNEKTKPLRQDIIAFSLRLKRSFEVIEKFMDSSSPVNQVKWLEIRPMKGFLNVHLISAELDISKLLEDYLFKPLDTTILASATLSTRKSFDFIKNRLGLSNSNKGVIEKIYNSPFDFEKQALLVVPKDINDPFSPKFSEDACLQVLKSIEASKGGVFVLFTSFSMLKAFQYRLQNTLSQNNYPLFVQGEDQRKTLLEKFKRTKRAVLFGTDSFWEGVDVVGDALRLVIIVKLPFKVPSEPIIEARTEAIDEKGGDSFIEYTIPSAIVKFKQGFGRLIRTKDDRGCILCLDKRLLNKGYGKFFLESLPKCGQFFDTKESVEIKMKEFYSLKRSK
jgi:ATP-dependent DNA helicase DinG